MKARVPSIIITVAVVAIVVAVIAVAVTRDSGGADALTVNGQSISQATINHELDTLSEAKVYQQYVTTPGAVDAGFGVFWLNLRIASVAMRQLLAREDLTVSPKQRARATKQFEKELSSIPKSAKDVLIDYSYGGKLLSDKVGGDDVLLPQVRKQMRKLDVSVDPKYGRWVRAEAQVCPPVGCAAGSNQSAGSG